MKQIINGKSYENFEEYKAEVLRLMKQALGDRPFIVSTFEPLQYMYTRGIHPERLVEMTMEIANLPEKIRNKLLARTIGAPKNN